MTSDHAGELNTGNADANHALTKALGESLTTPADPPTAEANVDAADTDLGYANSAYTAIRAALGADSHHTNLAYDNLDAARQTRATAVSLRQRAAAQHVAAEPAQEPGWPLTLPDDVAAHDHVHIVTPHPHEPDRFWASVAEANGGLGKPVAVLSVGRQGDNPTDLSLTALNHLAESLLWRRQVPVVVTRGTVTDALRDLAHRYGAALVSHATGARSATSADGLVRMASLDKPWQVELPDGTIVPFCGRLTPALFDTAATTRPTAPPPTPTLATWLSSADWANSRNAFACWEQQLREPVNRDGLTAVLARAPRVPALRTHQAILDLADQRQADLAYDVLTAAGDAGDLLVTVIHPGADISVAALAAVAEAPPRRRRPPPSSARSTRSSRAGSTWPRHTSSRTRTPAGRGTRRLMELVDIVPAHAATLTDLSTVVLTC